YNVYVSVAGDDEARIRRAVDRMCRELAADVGTRLAAAGKPAEIHEGFWYDDGVVAFDEGEIASSYCRAHGLSTPAKTWTSLVDDARAFRAMHDADLEG